MKLFKPFLIASILLGSLFSCKDKSEDDIISSSDSIYYVIDELMHSWYLWYDEAPELDYLKYDDPSELLDDYRVSLDKWSYVDDAETVLALYEEGEYFGYGFYLRQDLNGDIWVPLVFKNSTAYKQGVRKGDKLISIGGTLAGYYDDYDSFFDDSPQTLSFQFRDNNGTNKDFTLSKETVVQNAVFYSEVYDVSGMKTGYIVYDSFLGYSLAELEETFSYFGANDIDELIVDLRYNGGGYVSIAEDLAEIIAPASTVGSELYTIEHNNMVATDYDTTVYFKNNDLNLDLDRVFFITSPNSASASELVINCLEPYMEVLLIGSKTHGKPVGMYGFRFQDWMISPVTNKIVNADGYGDYYNGLPVDMLTGEGLNKSWGDVTDPALDQAFHYITFGSFDYSNMAQPKSADNEPGYLGGARKDLLIMNR